jgi:hypothetical protein
LAQQHWVMGSLQYTQDLKKPSLLNKLEPMKEKFGNSAGNFIHIIAYTIVPTVAGCVFINSGLAGRSIF